MPRPMRRFRIAGRQNTPAPTPVIQSRTAATRNCIGTIIVRLPPATLRLWLDDQRTRHTGFTMAGNAAVEGVGSGRARREEREGGHARGHRNVDTECVDVEGVRLGVPVFEP